MAQSGHPIGDSGSSGAVLAPSPQHAPQHAASACSSPVPPPQVTSERIPQVTVEASPRPRSTLARHAATHTSAGHACSSNAKASVRRMIMATHTLTPPAPVGFGGSPEVRSPSEYRQSQTWLANASRTNPRFQSHISAFLWFDDWFFADRGLDCECLFHRTLGRLRCGVGHSRGESCACFATASRSN